MDKRQLYCAAVSTFQMLKKLLLNVGKLRLEEQERAQFDVDEREHGRCRGRVVRLLPPPSRRVIMNKDLLPQCLPGSICFIRYAQGQRDVLADFARNWFFSTFDVGIADLYHDAAYKVIRCAFSS